MKYLSKFIWQRQHFSQSYGGKCASSHSNAVIESNRSKIVAAAKYLHNCLMCVTPALNIRGRRKNTKRKTALQSVALFFKTIWVEF